MSFDGSEDGLGEGPPPQRLTAGLDRVLSGLGAPSASVLTTVLDRWEELVGPEAADVADPVSLEHGTLVVAAKQPAWVSQLRWMEADVVRRSGRLLGPGVITALEVHSARP